MSNLRVPANYYCNFDADYALDVPAEGYGGWQKEDIEINPDSTAVVVMHAWDCGTYEKYPGWHRAAEWIPRAQKICREVFPPLLSAVRQSGLKLLHVASSASYCSEYPGYKRALELSGAPSQPVQRIERDHCLEKLYDFKMRRSFCGMHNRSDIEKGFKNLDFAVEALPQGDEGIAVTSDQLLALCTDSGVNHLIYAGFAINWCLFSSPGGMVDMQRRGFMCSALRQAVTAVENRETAGQELCKEIALWRVGMDFGFVFDVEDIIRSIMK